MVAVTLGSTSARITARSSSSSTRYASTRKFVSLILCVSKKGRQIRIWRPFLDTHSIKLTNFRVEAYLVEEELDLAVIRAEVLPSVTATIEPLPFRDNFQYKKSQKMLLVVYSEEFRE